MCRLVSIFNRRKWKYIWHIMTIIVFCYGSSILIRFAYILPVHGGGKYLFGGTYIILYYLGIVSVYVKIFNRTAKQRMYILIFSTAGWISWWLLNVYAIFVFPVVHINKWVLRICVFIPMLVLPVLAVCLLRKLRSLFKSY